MSSLALAHLFSATLAVPYSRGVAMTPSPPSSNRACDFPAHGFPMLFTPRHAPSSSRGPWGVCKVHVAHRDRGKIKGAIYGSPRDARGKSPISRRKRCSHISGIDLGTHCGPRALMEFAYLAVLNQYISLNLSWLLSPSGFQRGGRAFHAIAVTFTLSNSWRGTRLMPDQGARIPGTVYLIPLGW
ncbi:hypothetical protein Thiowin_00190 [Thiorhodovibrio winogradskyi]|uniref:Secreted protein n=1 Tax=Thiorhodovibrio winogradskyi TaxID=77007 RepID=A0ABZ0S3K9_9GAMM